MKLAYDKSYWDDYYNGPYASTFRFGFPLEHILTYCWSPHFKELPKSFADIGSRPGQTLHEAESLMPGVDVYGIEVQNLPKLDHPKVIIGDFLEMSKDLKPAELVYVACTMYVPWSDQAFFIKECLRLATKAICFANVYLDDRGAIPNDMHRKVIYRDKSSFDGAIESLGGWTIVPGSYSFFVRSSNI